MLNALLGLFVGVVYVIGKALDEQVTVTGAAVFVPTSVVWTAELVVLIAGRDAFRARRPRRRAPAAGTRPPAPSADGDPRTRAADLLVHRGGENLSWMTTWPDNSYFFPDDDGSYIAYRAHAGVAVALGDPVGAADDRARTISRFAEMCDRTGLVPCLFSATARAAEATDALGWRSVQVAEDTVIDLPDLEFRGKAWQDVRTALNRAKKDGVEYRLVSSPSSPVRSSPRSAASPRSGSATWASRRWDSRSAAWRRPWIRGCGSAWRWRERSTSTA